MIPILFNISVLLDVQANLPETSPFFVCPNGFAEYLFSNVYGTWDVQLYSEGEKRWAITSDWSRHDFAMFGH